MIELMTRNGVPGKFSLKNNIKVPLWKPKVGAISKRDEEGLAKDGNPQRT